MDWHSRKVLAWRLSNTMETDFCIEAVEKAIRRYGTPEIFNTDQGAQFTSVNFTGLLKDHDIAISMDGRGRAQDNIFIERLWWTLKYNYIYLRSFDNGADLRKGLRGWFSFYNQERFHQALDNLTPDEVCIQSTSSIRGGGLMPPLTDRLKAYLYVKLSSLSGPPPYNPILQNRCP